MTKTRQNITNRTNSRSQAYRYGVWMAPESKNQYNFADTDGDCFTHWQHPWSETV